MIHLQLGPTCSSGIGLSLLRPILRRVRQQPGVIEDLGKVADVDEPTAVGQRRKCHLAVETMANNLTAPRSSPPASAP